MRNSPELSMALVWLAREPKGETILTALRDQLATDTAALYSAGCPDRDHAAGRCQAIHEFLTAVERAPGEVETMQTNMKRPSHL